MHGQSKLWSRRFEGEMIYLYNVVFSIYNKGRICLAYTIVSRYYVALHNVACSTHPHMCIASTLCLLLTMLSQLLTRTEYNTMLRYRAVRSHVVISVPCANLRISLRSSETSSMGAATSRFKKINNLVTLNLIDVVFIVRIGSTTIERIGSTAVYVMRAIHHHIFLHVL